MPLLAIPVSDHRPGRLRDRAASPSAGMRSPMSRAFWAAGLRAPPRAPRADLWGAAKRPTAAGGHRRPPRLGGARRRARRPARLRAVLQPRLLSRRARSRSSRSGTAACRSMAACSARSLAIVLFARRASSTRSSLLDLAAAVDADRPVLRPHRQLHQRRAVGPRRADCRGRWCSPMAGPLPRHPSQLYEAFARGAACSSSCSPSRCGASASARPGLRRRPLRARLCARPHRSASSSASPTRSSASCSAARSRRSAAASPWACCCRCRWSLVGLVADRARRARRDAAAAPRGRRPAREPPSRGLCATSSPLEGPITRRALHGALPRPSASRLLHDARSLRRGAATSSPRPRSARCSAS